MSKMKKNRNMAKVDVCYITSWVGDYHAPRLLSLNYHLNKLDKNLLVVQLDNRSKLYSHDQIRRNKLIKQLKFILLHSQKPTSFFLNTFLTLFKTRPNNILVLGYNDPISLAALLYSKIFFKKIFFMSDSKKDDQPRSIFTELVKSFIIKFFDGALVAGEKHKKYFKSLGFRKEITIPYDVIDNRFFSETSVKYYARASKIIHRELGEKYILCVSRLVQRKQVDLALKIYHESKIAEKGWNFVLVGDGPERQSIELLINELNLNDKIIHLKNIPNHRMPALYSNATALILASEYDQWGLCVNEAMSCGVPSCVTSRCGVANEIVNENNGLVFEDNNIIKAVNWLRKVCSDKEFHEKLSHNAKSTMTTWGVDDYAISTLKLLKYIVKEN